MLSGLAPLHFGMTIGAVLSITQWSMLVFTDAYVPY